MQWLFYFNRTIKFYCIALNLLMFFISAYCIIFKSELTTLTTLTIKKYILFQEYCIIIINIRNFHWSGFVIRSVRKIINSIYQTILKPHFLKATSVENQGGGKFNLITSLVINEVMRLGSISLFCLVLK